MSYFPYNLDGATGIAFSTPASLANNHDWAIPTASVPLQNAKPLGTTLTSADTYVNVFGSTGFTSSNTILTPLTVIAGVTGTYIYITSIQTTTPTTGTAAAGSGYITLYAGQDSTAILAYVPVYAGAGSCLNFSSPLRVSNSSNASALSLLAVSPFAWNTQAKCNIYVQGFRYNK